MSPIAEFIWKLFISISVILLAIKVIQLQAVLLK